MFQRCVLKATSTCNDHLWICTELSAVSVNLLSSSSLKYLEVKDLKKKKKQSARSESTSRGSYNTIDLFYLFFMRRCCITVDFIRYYQFMTPLAGKPKKKVPLFTWHGHFFCLLAIFATWNWLTNKSLIAHNFFSAATVNVYLLCAPPPPPAIKNDDGKFMHFMLGPEEQTAQLGMPPPETADEYSPKRGIYKPTEGDIHCFFSYC